MAGSSVGTDVGTGVGRTGQAFGVKSEGGQGCVICVVG